MGFFQNMSHIWVTSNFATWGSYASLLDVSNLSPLRLVGGDDDDDRGPQKLSNSDRHVTLALKKRHGVLGIPGIHNPPNK